ncbi:MAG: alpha/beta hydrolase [Marinilabiliales bacterium]|nr:MAG: alpha/beta hydrolase [Marinilabiliales bacterium]
MEKLLTLNNGNIGYKTEGSGPCIVLLHGFLESSDTWGGFSQKLSEYYTVISPDLPGHGSSSVFGFDHPMEFMASAVKAILDAENIDSAVVCGHSMGGYVSLAFAKAYPGVMKGLILFHSHASADSEEVKENRLRTVKVVEENKLGFITSFVPSLFSPANTARLEGEITRLQEESKKTTTEGVTAALLGMRSRKSSLGLLTTAQYPVLFISGKQDSRIPLDKALSQMVLPPHSEALILDNTGHMGFIEQPQKTVSAVIGFTKRCFLHT